MYRLVLIALMVIGAAAVLLSLVGQLAFPVTDLLATGAVAVGASFASSWIFALLFRTKAHPESSLITGFLLFFLFYPSTALADLSSVALAAVIASASKYLLAIRARHIFNPAAIGAFVVSLLGLNFAVWWVATGLLLPLTAVGAFLVLYRSRRLPVGLTFVAIAALLVTVRLVSSGQDVGEALVSAFTQFPIVFLAGFMLSEPLTLPPRRWQQLTVAAIAAVVFSTVFGFGPITNTPELALLVGNLVAFAFGQRRGIRLTYLGKRRLTPSSWELSFQPAGSVRFRPGQYLELSVPHRADFRGSRRIFSISSAPTTDGPLTVALSVPERPSSFKRAFLALEPGAKVMATGIGGDFMLPRDTATPVVLLAGGIGITPFASQLAHDHELGHDRDVVVVYAVRDNAELGYADLLEKSRVPVVLVSPARPDELPPNWVWAGAGRITPDLLRSAVPDLTDRRAFVSGPPGMVADLRAALKGIGVKRVSADYFSGY
ncbi:FAD-dependent oxidoreductase [Conyzicola nivalis]|nr:oxidoreductase [Conyzicola nivalis]